MPLAPTDVYHLEKGMWTDADFERMGLHDVSVHSLAFRCESYELLLDIDYIFAWVDPEPPAPNFTFWIAPATLVFREVWGLKIHYEADLGLELQGIRRSDHRIRPHPLPESRKEEWRWLLDGNEGQISFWSTGYSQYTRAVPKRFERQSFSMAERAGVSFDQPLYPNEKKA